MSKHTELPWGVSTWIEQPNNKTKPMISAKGVTVAITHPAPICQESECEANARLIVNAVNNYERLREALRNVVDGWTSGDDVFGPIQKARALLQELDNLENGS